MAAEDYVGKPGFEKKLHKTHFGVVRELKTKIPLKDDPNWEYVGVGKWRWIGNKKKGINNEQEVGSRGSAGQAES